MSLYYIIYLLFGFFENFFEYDYYVIENVIFIYLVVLVGKGLIIYRS